MLQASEGKSTKAGHKSNRATQLFAYARRSARQPAQPRERQCADERLPTTFRPIRLQRAFPLRIPAVHTMLRTRFQVRGVMRVGALALLLVAGVPLARSAQATTLRAAATEAKSTATRSPAPATSAPFTPATPTVVPRQISYVGGQLTINVLDATLADVLAKVAALTGVKLDVPPGASAERMPVVELGPGPAREILALLLSESTFDFVIQASATDPEKMQSVLLMTREKKSSTPNGVEAAARGSRGSFVRAAAAPPVESVEEPAPAAAVATQPENGATDPNSSNPQPASTQPDQSTPNPLTQPGQSSLTRPGAMSPPATLSPQSVNQQLQQMYQQRIQMVQQERQTGQSATPANPGNN
jgi:hypothetical protein